MASRTLPLAAGIVLHLLVMAPLDAGAQVVATSLQELRALVKRGDVIQVTGTDGRTIRGTLGELSASDLELLARKTGPDGRDTLMPQRLPERDVQQVRIEQRDSLWNGTLIGFSPGGTVGLFVLFVGAGCDCYTIGSRAPLAIGTILLAGGIGAAVGAGIDAVMRERPTVYRRLPTNETSLVHVSPLDELRARVRPGDSVRVTTTAGATIRGTVAGLQASWLEVRPRGDASAPLLRVSQHEVNNVVAERFDSLWNGTLGGLAVGAASGLLIELAARNEYEAFTGGGAIGLGMLGAGIGVVIDAVNREKTTVYVQPPKPRSSAVRVFPAVSKSGAGVQVSVALVVGYFDSAEIRRSVRSVPQ